MKRTRRKPSRSVALTVRHPSALREQTYPKENPSGLTIVLGVVGVLVVGALIYSYVTKQTTFVAAGFIPNPAGAPYCGGAMHCVVGTTGVGLCTTAAAANTPDITGTITAIAADGTSTLQVTSSAHTVMFPVGTSISGIPAAYMY